MAALLLFTAGFLCAQQKVVTPRITQGASDASKLFSALPLSFEENDGQFSDGIQYVGRTSQYTAGVERDGLTFLMPGNEAASVHIHFAGSEGGSPVALSSVAYRSNYFIGRNPEKWHRGVPAFSRVGMRGIYPGIDAEFYEKNGQLEHDYVVAPGSDAARIALSLSGGQQAKPEENGDVVIPAGTGELRLRKPAAFQFDGRGRRVEVAANYVVDGATLRFQLGDYDHTRTLVIDPVILFASYLTGAKGSTPVQMVTATDSAAPHATHLYVTGSVASVLGFPPPGPTSAPSHIDNARTNTFFASMTASNLGSSLDWITYMGGDAGDTTPTAMTISSNASLLYVAGTTTAKHLPSSAGSDNPAGSGTTGFVVSVSTTGGSKGAISKTQFISTVESGEADATVLTGIDLDNSGNVYLSGYGPGTNLSSLADHSTKAGLDITPNAASTHAFIVELNASLQSNALFWTYVESPASAVYHATGVKVNTDGGIYVSGETSDSFPLADQSADYQQCANKTSGSNVFTAEIFPPGIGGNKSTSKSIFGFTAVGCGATSQSAHALALISGSTPSLYVVGDTTSTDLAGSLYFSTQAAPTAAQLEADGLSTTHSGTSAMGYVWLLTPSDFSKGAFTYLGAVNGNTSLVTAAMDSKDSLLHVGGYTQVLRPNPPTGGSLTGAAGAHFLPAGQTPSLGEVSYPATSSTPYPGILYSVGEKLDSVTAITYFGAPTTRSTVESVQSDDAGNAYLLVDDMTPAAVSGSAGYTAAAAIEPELISAASQHNAYVAEVQGFKVGIVPAGLTLAKSGDPEVSDSQDGTFSSCAPDTCSIGYESASSKTWVKYTWTLSTTTQAENVVLNFWQPPTADGPILAPFTISDENNYFANGCVSTSQGTTCSAANIPAGTNETITLITSTDVGASKAANIGATFALKATIADAEGESNEADHGQVKVAAVPTVKLDLTQDNASVDAATSTSDTAVAGHITLVHYTATLANTGAVDASGVSFTISLPSEFAVIGTSSLTNATCTTHTPVTGQSSYTSECTGVSIPANSNVVYTVTGVYLGGRFGASVVGPFTRLVKASATSQPPTSSSNIPSNPSQLTTTVRGYAALSYTMTAPTYPAGASAFNLGATGVQYTIKVTNNGVNAIGSSGILSPTLTNTLPSGPVTHAGFTVTSVNSTTGGSCQSNGTKCTITSLPAGGSITFTITGSFPDNGASTTNPSIVDVNSSSAVVNNASTALTLIDGTYDATAQASASATAITVQRSVHLKFEPIITSGKHAAGVPTAMANAYNLGTAITYSVAISNEGPNIAVNVPLNTVFAPPTGYTPPAAFVKLTTVPNGVSCTVNPGTTAPATPNCTITSLRAKQTTTLNFVYTYPDINPSQSVTASAVPATASSAAYAYTVSTKVPYANAVDSATAPGVTIPDSTASQTSTIYRSYHLVLKLSNSGTMGESGAGYTQPAYDLGTKVSYGYSLVNQGPNYAINVPLTNTLGTPAGYAVPANAYAISAPTSGNAVCTPAPTYASCTLAYIAPQNDGQQPLFNVDISYPDNPVTSATFTAQDVSAVPSASTSATYTYSANIGAAVYTVGVDSDAVSNPSAAATDSQAKSPTNIYRTSHLVIDTSTPVTGSTSSCAPSSPTPCFYMVNTSHTSDTATYAVHITNNGPNIATRATVTLTPPNAFLGSPNFAFAVANATQLSCSTAGAAGSPETCTGYIPVGASVNTATFSSQFNSNTVPASVPYTNTNTPPNVPGSAATMASALGATANGTLPVVNVDRAIHLVTAKHVTPDAVNKSPNGFTMNVGGAAIAAVNLDEKVAGNAPGANDLVDITVQVGNSGLNDAVNVMVSDSLPPYFTLTSVPDPSVATCTVAVGTSTGATARPFTCNVVSTISMGSYTQGAATPFSSGAATLVFKGKFQDNGRQADIVPLNQNASVVTFGAATSASKDAVNLGATSDATSAQPRLPVMRAAHLRFSVAPRYVQPVAGDPALPVIGATAPAIAEAQCVASISGGRIQCDQNNKIINSLRYQVQVTNDGPNIAVSPQVNTMLPVNFTSSGQSIEPSTSNFPVSGTCGSGQICQNAGMIAPHQAISFNFDGYFGLNTLTAADGNMGIRNFSSTAADVSVVDSAPSAPVSDRQTGAVPITIVNTPSSSGTPFLVAPFVTGGSGQPMTLVLRNVQTAGVTTIGAASSTNLSILPSGPSPNPPDKGAVKPLYRYGQNSITYTLGTTAIVPTPAQAGNTDGNPTGVCLTAIPDTFQKPERVLMWALANAPSGTVFNRFLQADQKTPVAFSGPVTGDITYLVLSQAGAGYSVPATLTQYPAPAAQPQPGLVCGSLNGLPAASAPASIALLEPVNFAPYVGAKLVPVNGAQPGKGVTAGAQQIDLTIEKSPRDTDANVQVDHDYDYNDADPCYTGDGTTRGTCNDNTQLMTFLFGGGNIIGATSQVESFLPGQLLAPNAQNAVQQFNLSSQAQLYLVLADQLGAQGYPLVTYQGTTNVCDPGTPTGTYVPSSPYYVPPSGSNPANACPVPPSPSIFAGTPAQGIWPGLTDPATHAADMSVTVGSLQSNSVNSGSAGLIPLPQPLTQPPSTTVPKEDQLAVNITAGQTAGFAWNWLPEQFGVQPPSPSADGPVLNLACVSADGTNLAAAGITCTLPAIFTYFTESTAQGAQPLIPCTHGGKQTTCIFTTPPAVYVATTGKATVGALQPLPGGDKAGQILAAVVFPLGAVPLVLVLRRRKALGVTGWLAILLLAAGAGLGIGCGGNTSFGGGTAQQGNATPSGTYSFVVTATGTDSSGNPINIKSYPFSVVVSQVQ